MYDWIIFFKELSEKIIANQNSLNNIAVQAFGADNGILQWPIDPFTFIYVVASRNSEKNLFDLKNILNMKSDPPKDRIFPSPQGNSPREFHLKGDYSPLSEADLWNLFKMVVNSSFDSTFENLFTQALKIGNVALAKLTSTLFLINPGSFLPLDKRIIALFPEEKLGDLNKVVETEGYPAYRKLLDQLKNRFKGCAFWEMNRLAYAIINEELEPNFDDNWNQISSQQDGDKQGDYIDDWFKTSEVTIGYTEGEIYERFSILKRGEIVVAKKGINTFHGIGIVKDNKIISPEHERPVRREVIWLIKDKSQIMNHFAIGTLKQIDTDKVYDQIKGKYPEFWYFIESYSSKRNQKTILKSKDNISMDYFPKNLILYGPPGTGKTYITRQKALDIIDPSIAWTKESDDVQKKKFKEYMEQKRISFVTFHQSFGYEEFVEGIRPVLDESDTGELKYEVKSGIFKEICERAKTDVSLSEFPDTDWRNRKIWKMSLGNTAIASGSVIFDYCIKEKCVLLGFGEDTDYGSCSNKSSLKEKYISENNDVYKSAHVSILNTFKNEMEIGDLVLISFGNRNIRGLVEISGEYSFEPEAPEGYTQKRTAKWLWYGKSDEEYIFWDELLKKQITQRTLYNITPNVKEEALERFFNTNEQKELSNFVLIIDEINRGNVARIFGELITLIEEDKRVDGDNPLSVNLPYSGKSFAVPSNLYIIATMNTADRSLVSLDTALRRRFEFEEMRPDPSLLKDIKMEEINIVDALTNMNLKIKELLDRDHEIGHAYFWSLKKDPSISRLKKIFLNRILPQLQEHFFDNPDAVKAVLESSKIPKEKLMQILGADYYNEYFGN